jgi:hypothetical protein
MFRNFIPRSISRIVLTSSCVNSESVIILSCSNASKEIKSMTENSLFHKNLANFFESSSSRCCISASSSSIFKPSQILLQAAKPTMICPLCQRQFKSPEGLSDHIRDKHPDELKRAQMQKQQLQQKSTTTTDSTTTTSNSNVATENNIAPATTSDSIPASTSSVSPQENILENKAPEPVVNFKCEHCQRKFKSHEACMTHIKDKHKDLLAQTMREYKLKLEAERKAREEAAETKGTEGGGEVKKESTE